MELTGEVVLTEAEVWGKVVYLVSFWMEALVYGLYLFLFLGALPVLLRKEVRKLYAPKVFLAGNTIMFLAISFHNWLNLYRLVIAFAYQRDIRSPLIYLNDVSDWTCFATPILLGITVWVGDMLVIYRCFLIWQRNYWVIIVPSILFLCTIAVQLVNFWWIAHQQDVGSLVVTRWPILNSTYPMYLAQNMITTALIVYKIWARYRGSRAAGVVSLNTPSLVSLMRAIVESAAIYTASMLVMVVMRALDHRSRLIPTFMLYPTTGIVFVLMAVRVHAVHEDAKQSHPSPSFMPTWIFANEPQTSSGFKGKPGDSGNSSGLSNSSEESGVGPTTHSNQIQPQDSK